MLYYIICFDLHFFTLVTCTYRRQQNLAGNLCLHKCRADFSQYVFLRMPTIKKYYYAACPSRSSSEYNLIFC